MVVVISLIGITDLDHVNNLPPPFAKLKNIPLFHMSKESPLFHMSKEFPLPFQNINAERSLSLIFWKA